VKALCLCMRVCTYLIMFHLLLRLLYWTDIGTLPRIERASMDGNLRTVIHDTDITSPSALTIDYGSQTIYWADFTLDRLEYSNVDGSNRKLLTNQNINSPFAMTFYSGVLYWTDTSTYSVHSVPINSPDSVITLRYMGYWDRPYGIHAVAKDRQMEGLWWT